MNNNCKKMNIHLIGICGTAMGNVAIGLKNCGHFVTGSDKGVYPPISTLLQDNNIEILEFNEENVKNVDLVIVGNAIPRGNVEAEYVLNNKIPFCSLPEAINKFFLKNKKLIMVTGTHGKTTTTSLIIHLLKKAGLNPSFMVGGVLKGFSSGFYFNELSEYFVMEGDEYDTAFFDKTSKFLKFTADFLVINYVEFDHGDIFSSLEDIKKNFRFLLKRTPSKSTVFFNFDDVNTKELIERCYSKVFTFGFSKNTNLQIKNVSYDLTKSKITLKKQDKQFQVEFNLPGNHNSRNVAAAISVGLEIGISLETILKGIESFQGVARRMEKKCENIKKNILIFEDFAHHPTAIKESIFGLKKMYSENRIFVVFEPATNTIRSGFFKSELVQAFDLADFVIILPIPIKKTVGAIDTFDKSLFQNNEKFLILEKIEEFENKFKENIKSGDIVIFMSNSSLQGTIEKGIKVVGDL